MQYHEFVKLMKLDPEKIMDNFTRHKADQLHMGLGLIGEFEEFVDTIQNENDISKVVSEAGDVYFYFYGFLMEEAEVQFETVDEETIQNPLRLCGRVGEFLKKVYIQDKEKKLDQFISYICQIEAYVSYVIVHEYNLKVEDILKENMVKLNSRHPKGFDKSK